MVFVMACFAFNKFTLFYGDDVVKLLSLAFRVEAGEACDGSLMVVDVYSLDVGWAQENSFS